MYNKFLTFSIFIFLLIVLTVDISALELRDLYSKESLEKLASFKTVKSTGKLTMAGLSGRIELVYSAPDKMRMFADFGIMSFSQSYDGRRGWMIDQNGQSMELTGGELKSVINAAYMSGLSYLIPNRMPGRVEYLSDTIMEQTKYHLFSILPDGGDSAWLYYNTDNQRIEKTREFIDEIELITVVSDFRQTSGVEMAYKYQTISSVPQFNSTIELTTIETNIELDLSLFMPSGVADIDYLFPEESDSVVLAFEYYNGHIFIKARVNGGEEVYFILDSGASTNVIDITFAREQNLDIEGEIPVKGISGYSSAGLTKIKKLSVGKITMINQIAGVIDLHALGLKRPPGKLGGLLGYDLISRFPFKIRYADRELIFYHPERFSPPDENYGIDFELILKVPLIRGRYAGQNGRFLIDLGNPFGLILHNRFVEKYNLKETFSDIKEMGGKLSGVGGKSSATAATGTLFEIGGVKIEKPPLMLIEAERGIVESTETDGNIGNLMLQKFTILMDYNRKRIYLLPPKEEKR